MQIEIYSDVVCPWCYIGERRLAAALAQRPDLEVTLHWRPFQLRPEMPAQGVPWEQFKVEKFGGKAQAEQIFARVSAAGAPDGVDFQWDAISSTPNTLDAHRLILWAAAQGAEWEMAERLFAAYFTEGRNLNDHDQLAALAEEVGLDAEAARAFLASDKLRAAVEGSQTRAAQLGIQGVPFYVINERYGISGAQPVEAFVQALDQLAGESVATV